MRFVVEERGGAGRRDAGVGFSPPIDLQRGQPVSITVVNQLAEPTAVHWHGIELDSYYDGVAGFGGSGQRLTPLVAPRDSFEARFTPPRSGTFIYHSHVDEPRQHRAGLVGALIVRDRAPVDSISELIFFFKSALAGNAVPAPLEVNGVSNPDTTVLRAGQRYRLRFIHMALVAPGAIVTLTTRLDSVRVTLRDTLLLRWRVIAKDGADLPASERLTRDSKLNLSMGETYDVEFVPETRGLARIEVRVPGRRGRLFTRVPIRVE